MPFSVSGLLASQVFALFGNRQVIEDEDDRHIFLRPQLELRYSGFSAFLSACGIASDAAMRLSFVASVVTAHSTPKCSLDFSGFLEAIVRVADVSARQPVLPSLSTPYVSKLEPGKVLFVK
jgi:hypothetical protein